MNHDSPSLLEQNASDWTKRWNRLANRHFWTFLLMAIGSLSSVIYPHPPLVAFGVIAGSTLPPKRALSIVATIWLINQLYGYGLRQYPQTAESLSWGLVMGLGTLLVTALAAIRPPFSKLTCRGHWLWVAIALVTGFLLLQSLILSLGFLLTGSHVLTWAILGHLLIKEVVWTIALTAFYVFLIRFAMRTTGTAL
jgi:hypothetical protein